MATQLDHVIMLLPYDLIVKPPAWITDLFNVSPGGTHADGKTENKLVLFQDGTYLELIGFINDDPEKRKGHWWDKPYGVVDFAFTTQDETFGTLPAIRQRLAETGTGISYADPQEGGRLRPDGQELKWRVTFPTGQQRGSVPFWCHDLTPRQRRVPLSPEATTHPSGAVGIGGVLVQVGEESVSGLARALAAIIVENKDLSSEHRRYEIGVPNDKSTNTPSIRVEAASGGMNGENDLHLALVIRTSRSLDVPSTHQDVDGGVVSILFEQ